MKGKELVTAAVMAAMAVVASCTSSSDEVGRYVDFLYQYMPLPDSTDYPRQFYEQNVALSLQAREAMPWGGSVPEREFRHFVVPVRVNNENLDSSRAVFFSELRPRVEGMSMQDAILEVNHWCHEHVTYRPTDARTSSPLATLRTAYGRCGEESTLLVAALRSVCIPARQVYTPRWAHTDDNHAWVEAWADGRWHFLGACEPEPVLDLGWFNESASRGMLMHTRVFGRYDGPEEVMSRTPCYTEINVIDRYAPTSRVQVQVTDTAGRGVADALVEFKVYNYAEFCTVASKTTDRDGRTWLTAGRGDMLLWASKDGRMGVKKVSFDKDKEVTVALSSPRSQLSSIDTLDIVPPTAGASLPEVSAQQREANSRRLAREDSIRRAYEATMPEEAWRGNHEVIGAFLDRAANKEMARRLLDAVSKKDLRDITMEVLTDNEVAETNTDPVYCRYVLSPRVENEWLTPYKAFLRQRLAGVQSQAGLVAWCRDSIAIDSRNRNPQHLRMQPMSVYRHRVTDALGRDIFFVSAARSLGFPARIDEVTGKPQYYEDGRWVDVVYDDTASVSQRRSVLKLNYTPVKHYDNPKYYVHFTLSRIVDGVARLMAYDEDATWQRDFSEGVEIDNGEYILTTGTRLASGKVLSRVVSFDVDGPTSLGFTMRQDREQPQVIGTLNAENVYHDSGSGTDKTLLSTTGRGYYVLGIVAPNSEPSNHALHDIEACREQFEKWGRSVVMLFETEDEARRFDHTEFGALPSTVVWGTDNGGHILSEVCSELGLSAHTLPVFVVCDTFNRVVFATQGYTINMGEQLMKVIGKL